MQDLTRYSPELRDIISRPQERFTRLLWWFLSGTFGALLLAGLLVQSPDILTAEARVSSSTPPTVLRTAVTAPVVAVSPAVPGPVSAGDWLAVTASPGNWHDIRSAAIAAKDGGPFSKPPTSATHISVPAGGDEEDRTPEAPGGEVLSLGELTAPFHAWADAYAQYALLQDDGNEYAERIRSYEQRAEFDRKDLANLQKSLRASRRQYSVRKEQHQADSVLLATDDILASEYQGSLLSMIGAEQQVLNAESSINAKKRSIAENTSQAGTLRRQYEEQLVLARSRLVSAHGEFCARADAWEQQHVLVSPYDGVAEWAATVSVGDRLEAGTPVINVIHGGPSCTASAVLPARGAGKAAPGQQVRVKLDAYPFTEFGFLEGTVRSITLNTVDRNYLVVIDLPNGTVSNAGRDLDFAETLYGTAEIITRRRTLLSKVFYRIYDILAGNAAGDPEHAAGGTRDSETTPSL